MVSVKKISPFFKPAVLAVKFEEVKTQELKAILAKRGKFNPNYKEVQHTSDNLFGIALSGGGIRSATLNLGVLEVLNQAGILPKADYLSTVSGGGYIGSYAQAKLRASQPAMETPEDAYKALFSSEDKERLKAYGYYLAPNKKPGKILHRLRMSGAFVFSLAMNWIWIILLFLGATLFFKAIFGPVFGYPPFVFSLWITTGVVLAWHFFLHPGRHIGLWSSKVLTWIEGVLIVFLAVYFLHRFTDKIPVFGWPGICLRGPICQAYYCSGIFDGVVALLALIIVGFFSNPNLLSMHRFYRDRLADAFMGTVGPKEPSRMLLDLNPGKEAQGWGYAPYPLINSCVNLFETGKKPKQPEQTASKQAPEADFIGAKASDYFLLSPLYCGSKLTGYIPTDSTGYRTMTLSTAVAISGAALNPEMGVKSNRVASFFMALFNLKLGYWALNPAAKRNSSVVWWPIYLFAELLGRAVTKMWRVNLSDGGHIENLAVYELLRRKCKLIIAVDAGADPKYDFSDLKNLVIRARNELGVAIKFKQDPETLIRPPPSKGFSQSHFVIADLEELPGGGEETGKKFGLLVYLKSSMKAQKRWKEMKAGDPLSDSFHYKTYHPEFPHESTADQFFEPAQWEAYYNLGKFMAGDLLGVDVRKTDEFTTAKAVLDEKTIDGLYDFFSNRSPAEEMNRA